MYIYIYNCTPVKKKTKKGEKFDYFSIVISSNLYMNIDLWLSFSDCIIVTTFPHLLQAWLLNLTIKLQRPACSSGKLNFSRAPRQIHRTFASLHDEILVYATTNAPPYYQAKSSSLLS